MEENTTSVFSDFRLTDESKSYLRETAKWAYFLSILGFIGVSFIVLMALFFGAIFSKIGSIAGNSFMMPMMAGGFFTFIYLFFAALYFFPVYYLFQFASKAKAALATENEKQLTECFQYLKSHYKFVGVLALIMLSLYGILFLFGIIGVVTSF